MKKNKTIRLVYFGDSITYGLGHDHKGVKKSKRWTDLLDYNLKKLEHEGTFIYSSNQGVNGDTTRLALERINDVFKFRPNLVIMQFGYNDCNYWVTDFGFPRVNINSFKFNIEEIINKLFASNVKKVILCTNYLMPKEIKRINGNSWNDNIKKYNKIIRKINKNKNIVIFDIEKKFINKKSNFLDENGKWLHLSEKGNLLYYNLIFNLIKKTIKKI